MPLRILIADDHAAMRRSVRALIESRAQWTVCAEAADGEEAVERTAALHPHVALLDVEMPGLNGFQAARRIRDVAPTVQILILTMHGSPYVHAEALRVGARGVVAKSDAGHALLDAIESLQAPDMAIPLAGSVVGEHRHIAAFFHSERERYRVLGPFIADGLARGEKALHLIDASSRGVHVRQLMHGGIDAPAAEARHQLELLPWEATYLRGGRFDKPAMMSLLRQMIDDARAEGYLLTRAIAHMEWALCDQPGAGDLVEYESEMNGAFGGSADVVICAYDLTKFSGQLILDVLRCHPLVVIAGRLRENPFFTPPAEMIEELRKRKTSS